MSISRSRALALLAAVPAAGFASPVRAQSVKIRMAAVPTESYAEPLYLLDGGFFAKAGLDVEINQFTTGGQITNALAGGALDVGIADSIQVGNGFIRGVPFGFFAGGMEYSTTAPTTQLCVAKNGPIKSAKDLDGQTIGVNGIGSMAEFSTREFIRTSGLDPARVKIVEIPPAASVAAIARGTVAAGAVSEPNLSAAADSDVVPLAKIFDYCAKNFYIDAWFANRDWLAKNPALVRKLTAAIYEGARWINDHHSETGAILAKWAKMEPEKIRRMNRATYDTFLDPKKIQPALDIAWKYHAMEKQITAAELIVKV